MTFLNPFEGMPVKEPFYVAFSLGVLFLGALLVWAAMSEPNLCCPCPCREAVAQ